MIDYRSKDSNVTDDNVKNNQESVDLLTDKNARGILWILFLVYLIYREVGWLTN